MLIQYGGDTEAKAQKRDICGGDFLTCDQLAEEVGFLNYEQVKRDAFVTKKVDVYKWMKNYKRRRTNPGKQTTQVKDTKVQTSDIVQGQTDVQQQKDLQQQEGGEKRSIPHDERKKVGKDSKGKNEQRGVVEKDKKVGLSSSDDSTQDEFLPPGLSGKDIKPGKKME